MLHAACFCLRLLGALFLTLLCPFTPSQLITKHKQRGHSCWTSGVLTPSTSVISTVAPPQRFASGGHFCVTQLPWAWQREAAQVLLRGKQKSVGSGYVKRLSNQLGQKGSLLVCTLEGAGDEGKQSFCHACCPPGVSYLCPGSCMV